MIILETQRLILRTWRQHDIKPMTAINQDPKVCEFLPKIGNRKTTETMIKNFIKCYKKHGFCFYAVELKATHELIGFVGLNIPSFEAHFTPAIEIGWRLNSNYWGKGYATEAAEAVLHYAFTKLGIDKIVAFTAELWKKLV